MNPNRVGYHMGLLCLAIVHLLYFSVCSCAIAVLGDENVLSRNTATHLHIRWSKYWKCESVAFSPNAKQTISKINQNGPPLSISQLLRSGLKVTETTKQRGSRHYTFIRFGRYPNRLTVEPKRWVLAGPSKILRSYKLTRNQENATMFGGACDFSTFPRISCRFRPRRAMWRHSNAHSFKALFDSCASDSFSE